MWGPGHNESRSNQSIVGLKEAPLRHCWWDVRFGSKVDPSECLLSANSGRSLKRARSVVATYPTGLP